MKHFVLFSLMIICLFTSVLAQNTDKKQNMPSENSKVTKEYDEKGNLTKFDSVYTYSWSGDTTMLKSISPDELSKMFGGSFGFFADSTLKGNSFFGDFDQMFAQPYSGTRDSMFIKQFKQFHQFKNSQSPNDSVAFNFNFPDDFGDENGTGKTDSISSKKPLHSFENQQKSMEEMMQLFELHMKEMEDFQKKFFEKQQKKE